MLRGGMEATQCAMLAFRVPLHHSLGSNHHKMDGGDGVELCFLACLPILSKLSFLRTILSEYTCHRRWRGGKSQHAKFGPEWDR